MPNGIVYPPWMTDGGSAPLRARILRRRASLRAMQRTSVEGKVLPPPIERGDCGGCGGWGVFGTDPWKKKRCPRCNGTGHALRDGPRAS